MSCIEKTCRILEKFVAEIQVETWTYIVADSGLLIDDRRGYTDVLQPCCDLKARVPGTDYEDSRIITRKLSLLAAVLFPSTMIGLIVPERTDLP
jgi:hypothetical protein